MLADLHEFWVRECWDVYVSCGWELVVGMGAWWGALEETLEFDVVAEVELSYGGDHAPACVARDDLFHDGVECPDGAVSSCCVEGVDDYVPWCGAWPGGEDGF